MRLCGFLYKSGQDGRCQSCHNLFSHLVFFVTLQEFSAFLYIKAVWGIERKWGYDWATVLNSAFCYKLHQRTPDDVPPAVL